MRLIVLSILGIFLLAGSAGAQQRFLEIQNQSPGPIMAIFVKSQGSADWGADLLAEGGLTSVPPGETIRINFSREDCFVDVMITKYDGVDATLYGASICYGAPIILE